MVPEHRILRAKGGRAAGQDKDKTENMWEDT